MPQENIEDAATREPSSYQGGPVADLAAAPLPTARTLAHRKALLPQLLKFIGFDLTIMSMVVKGHTHS